MSKFLAKSPKHCAEKHRLLNFDKLPKKLLYALSTFLLSVFSVIFLVWLILRPSKPDFYLKEADIYQLDLIRATATATATAPPPDDHLDLNSSIRITLVTVNPNKKLIGVYYDQLQVYASYKGQQITVYTELPPFYQGPEDSSLLTASLVGAALPVAPSLGYQVARDQTAGTLILSLKVDARLRWKVWTWVSPRYRFNVNCVAIIAFHPNVVVPPTVTSKLGSPCSSTVV